MKNFKFTDFLINFLKYYGGNFTMTCGTTKNWNFEFFNANDSLRRIQGHKSLGKTVFD